MKKLFIYFASVLLAVNVYAEDKLNDKDIQVLLLSYNPDLQMKAIAAAVKARRLDFLLNAMNAEVNFPDWPLRRNVTEAFGQFPRHDAIQAYVSILQNDAFWQLSFSGQANAQRDVYADELRTIIETSFALKIKKWGLLDDATRKETAAALKDVK